MGHRTSIDEELTRVEGDAGVLLYRSTVYRYHRIGGPHFVSIVIGTMLALSFIIIFTNIINNFQSLNALFFLSIILSCMVGFILALSILFWIIKSMPFRIYSNGIALDSVPLVKGLQRIQPLIANSDILGIRYDPSESSRFHSGLTIIHKSRHGNVQRKIGNLPDILTVLIVLRKTNAEKFSEETK